MSAVTPEVVRALAAEISSESGIHHTVAMWLNSRADRLEAAARTLGQVLCEACGHSWEGSSADDRKRYEAQAAAVISHCVGPDCVVLGRGDAQVLSNYVFDNAATICLERTAARRVCEALA